MKRSKKPGASTGKGPGGAALPEGLHPEQYRWIIDGHNVIFAVPAWEALQVEGRRREARRSLEDRLETFGRAIGVQIWVVYDGNQMDRDPDALNLPHLQTWYSNPPEEADDRILFLAMGAIRQGQRPLVVTSDQRTLAERLPPGVRCLDVGRFFRQVYARVVGTPEKWEPEGMREIEQHFLRMDGEAPEGDGEVPGR